MRKSSIRFCILLIWLSAVLPPGELHLQAAPISVRYHEGLVHGFLTLSTLGGQKIADGDLSQVARGNIVTSKLAFRFKDGSYQEEQTVYSQNRQFKLQKYHLIQKGPSFPRRMDFSIDTAAGQAVVRYQDGQGKEKVEQERMEIPADLANGIIPVLLKNFPAGAPKATLSMLVATPKPLMVKLEVARSGKEPLAIGSSSRRVTHFVVKVDIPGLKGLLAPLVGKHPPDNHVWILEGEAPAFVKSESQFFVEGPSWRIELTGPTRPPNSAAGTVSR